MISIVIDPERKVSLTKGQSVSKETTTRAGGLAKVKNETRSRVVIIDAFLVILEHNNGTINKQLWSADPLRLKEAAVAATSSSLLPHYHQLAAHPSSNIYSRYHQNSLLSHLIYHIIVSKISSKMSKDD